MTIPADRPPPDPRRLADLAARAHELAGAEGIPEAVQALADRWPGATSGTALYGFGAAVSLAIGDLAAALDAAAERDASVGAERVADEGATAGRAACDEDIPGQVPPP